MFKMSYYNCRFPNPNDFEDAMTRQWRHPHPMPTRSISPRVYMDKQQFHSRYLRSAVRRPYYSRRRRGFIPTNHKIFYPESNMIEIDPRGLNQIVPPCRNASMSSDYYDLNGINTYRVPRCNYRQQLNSQQRDYSKRTDFHVFDEEMKNREYQHYESICKWDPPYQFVKNFSNIDDMPSDASDNNAGQSTIIAPDIEDLSTHEKSLPESKHLTKMWSNMVIDENEMKLEKLQLPTKSDSSVCDINSSTATWISTDSLPKASDDNTAQENQNKVLHLNQISNEAENMNLSEEFLKAINSPDEDSISVYFLENLYPNSQTEDLSYTLLSEVSPQNAADNANRDTINNETVLHDLENVVNRNAVNLETNIAAGSVELSEITENPCVETLNGERTSTSECESISETEYSKKKELPVPSDMQILKLPYLEDISADENEIGENKNIAILIDKHNEVKSIDKDSIDTKYHSLLNNATNENKIIFNAPIININQTKNISQDALQRLIGKLVNLFDGTNKTNLNNKLPNFLASDIYSLTQQSSCDTTCATGVSKKSKQAVEDSNSQLDRDSVVLSNGEVRSKNKLNAEKDNESLFPYSNILNSESFPDDLNTSFEMSCMLDKPVDPIFSLLDQIFDAPEEKNFRGNPMEYETNQEITWRKSQENPQGDMDNENVLFINAKTQTIATDVGISSNRIISNIKCDAETQWNELDTICQNMISNSTNKDYSEISGRSSLHLKRRKILISETSPKKQKAELKCSKDCSSDRQMRSKTHSIKSYFPKSKTNCKMVRRTAVKAEEDGDSKYEIPRQRIGMEEVKDHVSSNLKEIQKTFLKVKKSCKATEKYEEHLIASSASADRGDQMLDLISPADDKNICPGHTIHHRETEQESLGEVNKEMSPSLLDNSVSFERIRPSYFLRNRGKSLQRLETD